MQMLDSATSTTPTPVGAPVLSSTAASEFPPIPASESRGPLINRDFALLWSGQLISTLGDFIFNTAVIVWIAADLARGQSWAPLAVSGVLVAAALSAFALGPLAGVFADRWDKRRTLLVMAAAQGALILSLVPLSMLLSTLSQLVALYAIVFTVGACGALFQPAQIALLGDIVPEAQQPRAMGMGQASMSLAMLMGPAIAPLLVLNVGVAWAFILNAASFAVSCAAIFFIRPPRAVSRASLRAERHFWRELGEGLRFFLRSRVLRTLMIAYAIAMLGGGILNALDIFFTTQNLHTPLALYGLLNTALALGLIMGAILASIFAQRIGLGRTIWIALVALGVLVLIYARLTSFVPAAVLLALLGIPLASLEVAGGPLVLRTAPRELVGRVTSLLNPIVILAGLVGTALAGYLDGAVLRGFHFTTLGVTFGPVDTIYTAAGVLVLAGGLYAWVGLRGNAMRHRSPEKARVAGVAESA